MDVRWLQDNERVVFAFNFEATVQQSYQTSIIDGVEVEIALITEGKTETKSEDKGVAVKWRRRKSFSFVSRA